MRRIIITLVVLGLLTVGISIPVFADETMGQCPPSSPGVSWYLVSEPGSGMDYNGDGCVCKAYRHPAIPGPPHHTIPTKAIAIIDNNLPPD